MVKKQIFSFLILFSLVAGVTAQTTQAAKPDAAGQNLRKHVAYLASEKLEGRRTGTPGATYAAGYAANVFAQNKKAETRIQLAPLSFSFFTNFYQRESP
jgi:hypothetical protein